MEKKGRQKIMVDAKRYLRFQGRGLTGFITRSSKNDDIITTYLTFKRFATDDGHEIEPEEQIVNIPEIEERIRIISEELEGLKLIVEKVKEL